MRMTLVLLALASLLQVLSAQPQIASIVNSASFQPEIAASSIATIFGSHFASMPVAATTAPAPTNLDGIEALFCDATGQEGGEWDGCINGRVLFANQTQINVVLPDTTSFYATLQVTLRVRVNSVDDQAYASGKPFTFPMVPVAPGIYRMGFDCPYPQTCSLRSQADATHTIDRGSLVDQSGVLISSLNPLRASVPYSLYLTGMGIPNEGASGNSGPIQFLFLAQHGVTVFPFYAGLAPGFLGLYQMNFELPPDLRRAFTSDGVSLPPCSSITSDLQVEILLQLSNGGAPPGYAGDKVSVPLYLKPGDLECQM